MSPLVVPDPVVSSTPLKRQWEPLEMLSELPPNKKTSSPFLSLLLATQSSLTLQLPTPTLKYKTWYSRPSCASAPLQALKLEGHSKTTSRIPKSHWALLTASEKADLHQKMLEGHGYLVGSIVYGSALPHKHLSQFTLHHLRREPYCQLTVGPHQFNAVNPSLTVPIGLMA